MQAYLEIDFSTPTFPAMSFRTVSLKGSFTAFGHVAGSQNCMEVQLSAHCQHAMGHDAPEIIPTPFQYLALSDGCRCL